jgi:hypothetical protein
LARDALLSARRTVELWNSRDLEAVYEHWDSEIVIRPDPYFPESAELRR